MGQTYLLHTCCAPCASASVERLLARGEDVTLFFSNANLYPQSEYERRLTEVHRLAAYFSLPLIEDDWDHQEWLQWIAGLEKEPEKGSRCSACFRFSLLRTSRVASKKGIERFSTTLTISPHKQTAQVFAAASDLPGFVEDNFKKQGGYARSIELSRQLNLYRQSYCGCEFSMRAAGDGEKT
ncbi:MAG: epoxyqueuosine reductase QueH [Spirochaetota bacterium]